MDLSEQQVDDIRKWAAVTQYVKAVRRLEVGRGEPLSLSYVDLAITVGGGVECTPQGNYVRFKSEWQADLSKLLVPLSADVNMYDDTIDNETKRSCDERSVLLCLPKSR